MTEEVKKEEFVSHVDRGGRLTIPKHIRHRLGIAEKAGEVSVTVKVNKVYE